MTEQIQEAITLFSQEELAMIRDILDEIDAEQGADDRVESGQQEALAG